MSGVVIDSKTINQTHFMNLSLLILDTNQYCAMSTHERSPPVRQTLYDAMMCGEFERIYSVVKEEENLAYNVKDY